MKLRLGITELVTQVEPIVGEAEQKRSQLEDKLGDAGTALAKRERRIRQILSELLHSAADLLRRKLGKISRKLEKNNSW